MSAGSDSEEDLAGFGERVRTARLRIGLTQEQLGDLCGTDGGTVSRWELGKGYPQAPQLARLAHALGESIDHLVLGAPSEKAPAPMPAAFIEFLQTRSGRLAQQHSLVHTLLSVRLPPGAEREATVAFYRALLTALLTALEE